MSVHNDKRVIKRLGELDQFKWGFIIAGGFLMAIGTIDQFLHLDKDFNYIPLYGLAYLLGTVCFWCVYKVKNHIEYINKTINVFYKIGNTRRAAFFAHELNESIYDIITP